MSSPTDEDELGLDWCGLEVAIVVSGLDILEVELVGTVERFLRSRGGAIRDSRRLLI